jgi:hypothetical protein
MNATLSYARVAKSVPLGAPFEVMVAFDDALASPVNLEVVVADQVSTVIQRLVTTQSSSKQPHTLKGITTEGPYRVIVRNQDALNDSTQSNTFQVGAGPVANPQSIDPLNNGFIPITKMIAEVADAAVNTTGIFPSPSSVNVMAFLNRHPANDYGMIGRVHAVWNGGFKKGDRSPLGNGADMLDAGLFVSLLPPIEVKVEAQESVVDATFAIPFTPSDYPNWTFIASLEPADSKVKGGRVAYCVIR